MDGLYSSTGRTRIKNGSCGCFVVRRPGKIRYRSHAYPVPSPRPEEHILKKYFYDHTNLESTLCPPTSPAKPPEKEYEPFNWTEKPVLLLLAAGPQESELVRKFGRSRLNPCNAHTNAEPARGAVEPSSRLRVPEPKLEIPDDVRAK